MREIQKVAEESFQEIARIALREDIGSGDITTVATVPASLNVEAKILAKETGILAGLQVAEFVFKELDSKIRFVDKLLDGEPIEIGRTIAHMEGPGRAILAGERIALNFLQRMSGIATQTRRFVEAVKGTKAIILDTRKTVAGNRVLDKWAVRLGGGQNHRFGLYDMMLIKNNHIAVVGSISNAVSRVRSQAGWEISIEVEVRNLDELDEVLQLKVDRIMLDNLNIDEIREAVKRAENRVPLEASGNITLENVAAVAATGVQYISVGELTHSAKALDISLIIDSTGSKK